MDISLKGFDEKVCTFLCEPGVKKGDLVTIVDNGLVDTCTLEDLPVGICLCINGMYATVQLGGVATVKYAMLQPDYGFGHFVANSGKEIKSSAEGVPMTVLSVDASNNTVEILF